MIHDLLMFMAWGEKPRVIDCNSVAIVAAIGIMLRVRKAAR